MTERKKENYGRKPDLYSHLHFESTEEGGSAVLLFPARKLMFERLFT